MTAPTPNRRRTAIAALAVCAFLLTRCSASGPAASQPGLSTTTNSPTDDGLTALGRTIDWKVLRPGDTVPIAAFTDPTPRPETALPLAEQERRVGAVDRISISDIPRLSGGRCNTARTHSAAAPIVDAPVVGGSVVVPSTRQVGWVTTTARPGARSGVSVLAGHLTTGPRGSDVGPLWGAECLPRGAEIQVTQRGVTLTYAVTKVTKHPRYALPPTLFDPNGPNRIALVTCTGPYELGRGGKFWLSRNAIIWAEVVR